MAVVCWTSRCRSFVANFFKGGGGLGLGGIGPGGTALGGTAAAVSVAYLAARQSVGPTRSTVSVNLGTSCRHNISPQKRNGYYSNELKRHSILLSALNHGSYIWCSAVLRRTGAVDNARASQQSFAKEETLSVIGITKSAFVLVIRAGDACRNYMGQTSARRVLCHFGQPVNWHTDQWLPSKKRLA
jgi:hypothetical protein